MAESYNSESYTSYLDTTSCIYDVSFECKIKTSLDTPDEVGKAVESALFSLNFIRMSLFLYPNGYSKDSKGWISLFLDKDEDDDEEEDGEEVGDHISFTLGIKRSDGSVYRCFSDKQKFNYVDRMHGAFKLVQRSVLLDSRDVVAPNGVLTVFCTARMVEGCDLEVANQIPSSKSIHTLSQNFENLFLSGCDCDVTIEVKDQKFQAHRLILAARYKVFSSMFKHETLEKTSGVVKITDCDAASFKDFLHFIYSGKLDIVSSSNACNLYRTADKYDMNDLKEECCHCLARNLSLDSLCDTLLLATVYDEFDLLEKATEYFIKNTKAILPSAKWQSFIVENPLLGNVLFMKVMESMS